MTAPGTSTLKRTFLPLAIALLISGVLPSTCHAQSIPPVRSKALDDSEVTLPKPGTSQLLLIVIGFSHKSGPLSGAWAKRINADYGSNPHISFCEMAQLQSAPSFIRPMILHGIRSDVPAAQHSHFVPIYDHEPEWKAAVNFSAPDDPYVLLANSDGHILWQTRGPVSDAAFSDLKAAITKFSPPTQMVSLDIISLFR